MKHLKISCQKHKIDSLLLSSRCMTNFISTCSFLKIMKVVEDLFKKAYGEKLIYWKDICCRYTLELPHRDNSNLYLQHYVTENKEGNYLEIDIFQVSCPLSLPLLNIPNCQSVLKFLSPCCCLYLHDSYISKFEFMNYLFANLLVAWLYNFQLLIIFHLIRMLCTWYF